MYVTCPQYKSRLKELTIIYKKRRITKMNKILRNREKMKCSKIN